MDEDGNVIDVHLRPVQRVPFRILLVEESVTNDRTARPLNSIDMDIREPRFRSSSRTIEHSRRDSSINQTRRQSTKRATQSGITKKLDPISRSELTSIISSSKKKLQKNSLLLNQTHDSNHDHRVEQPSQKESPRLSLNDSAIKSPTKPNQQPSIR